MSSLESDAGASLCPQGCYWPCEHRGAPQLEVSAAASPMPVHDEQGQPLQRCQVCGGTFYSLISHAREHERLRTLGLMPERYPKQWPVVLPRP